MNNLSGIINIYKEKGFTSHDVVNIVRKSLDRIKTGHTGTLDPEACGVLPVCVGKATKLAEYIASDIKEYRTELTLGVSTDTQDFTGEIIERRDVDFDKEKIHAAVMSFVGEYCQTPPMYSALKVNGKKLYELAREGREIERKKRLVNIYSITINEFIPENKIVMTVLCSKGTYIRTLCHDIGEKLGCGGCMSQLLRTRAGNFFLKDSIKINDFKKLVSEGNIDAVLQPADVVLSDYRKVNVFEPAYKYLYNGNKISVKYTNRRDLKNDEKILVYDIEGRLIGIYLVTDNFIRPLTMLI